MIDNSIAFIIGVISGIFGSITLIWIDPTLKLIFLSMIFGESQKKTKILTEIAELKEQIEIAKLKRHKGMLERSVRRLN